MPHEIHKLTGWEALDALPPSRARHTAEPAVARLQAALDDPKNAATAYETLANFGELERTKNGYKNIAAAAVQDRCRRLIAEAFNVTHETGRTPKQLATEREVLIKALQFYDKEENWKEQDTGIGLMDPKAHDYGITAHEALVAVGAAEEERDPD